MIIIVLHEVGDLCDDGLLAKIFQLFLLTKQPHKQQYTYDKCREDWDYFAKSSNFLDQDYIIVTRLLRPKDVRMGLLKDLLSYNITYLCCQNAIHDKGEIFFNIFKYSMQCNENGTYSASILYSSWLHVESTDSDTGHSLDNYRDVRDNYAGLTICKF